MSNLEKLVCLAAALFFTAEVAVMATTTDCEVPNPSTEFCEQSYGNPLTCTGTDQASCEDDDMAERKKFPRGVKASSSGVTTEEPADCYRECDCVWNATKKECQSVNCDDWDQEDKTVVDNSVECPTEE